MLHIAASICAPTPLTTLFLCSYCAGVRDPTDSSTQSGVKSTAVSFPVAVRTLTKHEKAFLCNTFMGIYCREVDIAEVHDMITCFYKSYFVTPSRPRSQRVKLDNLAPQTHAFVRAIPTREQTQGQQPIKVRSVSPQC